MNFDWLRLLFETLTRMNSIMTPQELRRKLMDEKENHDSDPSFFFFFPSLPFYVQIYSGTFARDTSSFTFENVFFIYLFFSHWRRSHAQNSETGLEMTKSGSKLNAYVFMLLLCFSPYISLCFPKDVKWVGKSIINQTEHATVLMFAEDDNHAALCEDFRRQFFLPAILYNLLEIIVHKATVKKTFLSCRDDYLKGITQLVLRSIRFKAFLCLLVHIKTFVFL